MDNKVLHDRVVDGLPLESTFRNEVVKKVYKEEPRNVEFSNPVYAANYFRNAGLADFAPEIAKELGELRGVQGVFMRDLALYAEQIRLHLRVEERQLKVQSETLRALKELRKGLKRRSLLDEWW